MNTRNLLERHRVTHGRKSRLTQIEPGDTRRDLRGVEQALMLEDALRAPTSR